MQRSLEEKYGVSVVALNCEQMKVEDIHEIMRRVLYEFPVSEVAFYLPKWVEMLSIEHPIKQELLHTVQNLIRAASGHPGSGERDTETRNDIHRENRGGEDRDGNRKCYGADPICRKILL